MERAIDQKLIYEVREEKKMKENEKNKSSLLYRLAYLDGYAGDLSCLGDLYLVRVSAFHHAGPPARVCPLRYTVSRFQMLRRR